MDVQAGIDGHDRAVRLASPALPAREAPGAEAALVATRSDDSQDAWDLPGLLRQASATLHDASRLAPTGRGGAHPQERMVAMNKIINNCFAVAVLTGLSLNHLWLVPLVGHLLAFLIFAAICGPIAFWLGVTTSKVEHFDRLSSTRSAFWR